MDSSLPGKMLLCPIGGRTVAVVAEQLHGEERERAWRAITAASSRFTKYQQQTDRELPVIRLSERRVATAGPDPAAPTIAG